MISFWLNYIFRGGPREAHTYIVVLSMILKICSQKVKKLRLNFSFPANL